MTPEEEAAYALDRNRPRDWLDPAVQVEYDRLKMEREARPQVHAATARKTEPEPRGPRPLPRGWSLRHGIPPFNISPWLAIPVLIVWAAFFIWMTEGANIAGYRMNFSTLRSDISKIHLPAGYEKVSSSESGSDCRERRCTLMDFWVWGADGAHTPADACRDVRRAMGTGLPDIQANIPTYLPRGAVCQYYTSLESFFHPGLGKRSVEAFVWMNGKAKGSAGGYKVELLASYNYWDN